MTKKNYIIILIIVTSLFMVGCSNHVLIDEQNSKLLNYNFRISNPKKTDKILSNQRYAYTTKSGNNYAAVIIIQSKNASINQYLVKNNGSLNLTLPKDCEFVISLHENSVISYTWNINNNIDNGIIEFENRSKVEIPMPRSEKGKTGINYDRQNFYFKSLKAGSEKIIMKYESKSMQNFEPFYITFNIDIK